MMKNKGLLALTSAVILLPVLAGLALWTRLPPTLATHFGADGAPDGFMSRTLVVFMMPLTLLALHWVCLLASRHARTGSRAMSTLVMWVIPAASLFAAAMIYGYALNEGLDVGRLALVFVGFIFAVAGNYMPKITQNYAVGIKIPTTLADEDNWNRTHRFAAPVWVVGGLVLLVCGLLGVRLLGVPLVVIIALAVLPVGYSVFLAAHKA